MIIDFKEVVKSVALENRQNVAKDDPMIALITIMTEIAEVWQKTMDDSLKEHLAQHEEMASRWRKNTPVQVNKILDAAISAGKEAMAKGMSEGAEKVMTIVREREQSLLHEILDGALQKQKIELAAVTAVVSKKFKREYLRYYLWMLAGNSGVMALALIITACL